MLFILQSFLFIFILYPEESPQNTTRFFFNGMLYCSLIKIQKLVPKKAGKLVKQKTFTSKWKEKKKRYRVS